MKGPALRQRAYLSLVLALIVAVCFSGSTPAYEEAGVQMSVSATSALAMAFEASGLDDKRPAPFALQSYVVTIEKTGGAFDVSFDGRSVTCPSQLYRELGRFETTPTSAKPTKLHDLKAAI